MPKSEHRKQEYSMQKIVEVFTPQGGKHCITTSLKQVFDFCGCPLSEVELLTKLQRVKLEG
jgi:hypothetical protein